jgi:hypothetical protein
LDEARAALDAGDVEGARQRAARFLITADELKTPDFDPQATQQHLYSNLRTCLAKCPLVSIGWSASEKYVHEIIAKDVQPALRARVLAVDELSIIDISFNLQGHQRLADAYGRTQSQAHVAVESPGGFTLDALWLWLQALYTVQRLCLHDPASAPALIAAHQSLEKPPGADWLLGWADQWFPAWCRLCWRAGIMRCFDSGGRRVLPERLDIDGEDTQVPLNIPNCERPDLIAAGDLLANIWNKQPQPDFQRFPGALFETLTGSLLLPVPTWASPVAHADRALSLLIRLWKNGPLGSVQELALLELDGRQTVSSGAVDHWRQALTRSLPFAHFTSPKNIQITNLTQL